MKRIFALTLVLVLAFSLIGCAKGGDSKTVRIGASPTPHKLILEYAAPLMEEKGYKLEITEYQDYVIPNTAVESGELDANFFQHEPHMNDFNENNGTHLVSVAAVHYEPFGLYAGKTKAIADLADGATIAVPNDGSNEARALYLLQQEGLITLKADAGFTATVLDIAENPKNLNIVEVKGTTTNAQLVAEDVASQLERRIAFRRAMKQVIRNAMQPRGGVPAKGIKVTCSGRLAGADIARVESYHEGTIPLQTLRADIDYGFAEANTTYGKVGVKVWIYKGEILKGAKAPAKKEGGKQ